MEPAAGKPDAWDMRKIIAIIALAVAAATSCTGQPPDGPTTCDGAGCVIPATSVCIHDGVEVWGPSPEFDACMAAS